MSIVFWFVTPFNPMEIAEISMKNTAFTVKADE
jgi:hypothetical protein